jgi:hypothetical protein
MNSLEALKQAIQTYGPTPLGKHEQAMLDIVDHAIDLMNEQEEIEAQLHNDLIDDLEIGLQNDD